jgi:hypothetical protein
LARLPFRACVTTNFDKAFHDSYAIVSRQSALEFNLDDEKSLRAAAYEEQYFIARIHGRVEVPQTMVLAAEDYRNLLNNESYLSLLEHIFTRRQVLFVGFSFLDPAIRHVFRAIEKKIGSPHDGRHVALLTTDAKEDFVKSLERHNVKRITYDSRDNHRQLWDAIAAVKVGSEIIEGVQVPISSEPLALARKYLASCYARTTLKGGYAPLRGTIVEGMVVHLIKNAGRAGLARADLDHKLALELKVTREDVKSTIDHALDALVRESICKRISVEGPERYLYCREGEDNGLDSAISQLVKSTTSRFVVREGGTDTSDVKAALYAFFKGVVIQRGWDLGAAFAAGRGVEDLNIDRMMWSEGRMLAPKVVEGLIASCNNLFMHPDAESAKALSTLGRASFALELVLQSPRDTLFHSITLPQKIYLDANVLLPAITEGHPYHDVYSYSINRLTEAAAASMGRIQVLVYDGFLNEAVSHRRIAVEEMNAWGIDEALAIAKYYGTVNCNVFHGAFFNKRSLQPELAFEEFLRRYAPYRSERELAQWLGNQSLGVVSEKGYDGSGTIFGDAYHQLEVILADQLAQNLRTQKTIRHDAIQLTILDEDRKNGIRAILVSADRRLREGLRPGKFAYLGNAIIESLALAQLVDLLVGNPAEIQGSSSLLWSSQVSSGAEKVRSYLIDRALEQYDEAVAMQMTQLIGELAEEAASEADRRGVDLINAEGAKQAAAMKFLGTFDDRFYLAMQEIIERRRKESR